MKLQTYSVALLLSASCATTSTGPKGPASTAEVTAIALPGAPSDGVILDYLAYDKAHRRVWVPAGNTGKVDVVDIANGNVSTVEGFATSEMERHGKKRTVGPSSAAVGEGVVYVGNRGDSSICAIESDSLKKGVCATLDSMPDGLAYVPSVKEVWVTTPRTKTIHVLDVATPGAITVKTKISFEGEPEGFAVDDGRGLFYTNLEDKDRTLTIDVKTRSVTQTWMPGCGEDGPKGLALDRNLNFLFVACSDRVKVLDAGHQGKELSMLETGGGVDNLDYLEASKTLYAAAAKAAKLTVAMVDAQGKLTPQSVVATKTGARNPVVTEEGAAYLTDAPEGKILVISPARATSTISK